MAEASSRTLQVRSQRYDEGKQSLNLYKCECWGQVIGYVDTSKIKALVLTRNQLSDQHMDFLTGLEWPSLTQFWLNENKVTHVGLSQMAKKRWPALRELSLYDNEAHSQGLILLFNIQFESLTTLNVGLNRITSHQIWKFLDPECGTAISQLNISNNKLGAGGARLLTKVKFQKLVKLNLTQCRIGDEGARHLAKGHWLSLQELHLGYNNIGLDGLASVANSNWVALSTLIIFYNIISAIGITQLARLNSKDLHEDTICFWGMKSPKLQEQVKTILSTHKPNNEKGNRPYF